MKHTMFAPLLVLFLVLFGCAANGPKYSEQYVSGGDDANLYVYRPDTFLNSAVNAGVFVDDKLIGNLQNGSYVKAVLGEGEHTIKVGKQLKTFTIANDTKAYFRFKYGWALFFVIPVSSQTLDEIPESAAVGELNETRSPEKV